MLCPQCLRTGSVALRRAIVAQYGEPEPEPAMRISVKGLAQHAAALSGIAVEDLLGPKRFGWLARIRHAIVLVAIEYPLSTPQIGKAMGGRDHSTVINSRERGRALIERDPAFVLFVERLWAAAECEPQGPRRNLAPMPQPAALVVPLPRSKQQERVVVLPLKSEPGEYAPRHALPSLRALASAPDDAFARAIRNAEQGSAALLAAIRREYPHRFAA